MRRRRSSAGLAACAVLLAAPAWAAPAQPHPPRAPTGKEAAEWSALVVATETAQRVGDWKRVYALTRKRAAIEERNYGPESPLTATSWSWIGQALVRLGRDDDAEPYFRRALSADTKALGERDPQTLLATNNLAALLERQGRYAQAEPLRRALMNASRAAFGPQSAEAAAAEAAVGDVLRAQARPKEAEPLYRDALAADVKLAGENDPRTAADLGALAVALDDQGRHLEAEPLHRRSLAIRRQAFGERDAATAQAYARTAANLDAQGRHAEAEPLLRAALKTDGDVRGPTHPATAADLAALGVNLDAQGRHLEAEPILRRALAIRRKAFGSDSVEAARSDEALAANLAARDRLPEAERLHRRAFETLRVKLGPHDPATATAELALAGDLAQRREFHAADPLLREALRTRRTALGEQHPATAEAYAALAANLQHLDADGSAEQVAARAVAIVRGRRAAEANAEGSTAEAALRRARAANDAGSRQVYRRYLAAAWAATHQEPSQSVRLRDAAFVAIQELEVSPAAQALAQTTARTALAGRPAADQARLQQELAGQAQQIEGQLVRALPARDPGQSARIGVALDAVGRELAGLDARLHEDNPRYAEMASPPPLALWKLQQRLKPGEGLLVLAPAGDDTYVFAVSPEKAAWNRITGGEAEFERRMRTLRCEVDDEACRAPGAPRPNGLSPYDLTTAYSLYRDLVAPVEGALAGVDRLYVTAEGALGGLPLGLLPLSPPEAGASGTAALTETAWFADRYALTTLPSVASLRARPPARHHPSRRWTFAGFGDPAVNDTVFEPVPGTADELRAMARALKAPAGSVRLGGQATETAIRGSRELAHADVVAFATHSLPARALDGLDEPGLVFTPSAKDDGVLTASEAAGLHLSAEWVILSACDTAGPDGAPGADSLSGLARAFLYAGAEALLVSHWRVFDDATAALTVETLALQRADPKLSKAQALQLAMRTVRTGRKPDGSPLPGWKPDWAHPAYWAPFVVIAAGD